MTFILPFAKISYEYKPIFKEKELTRVNLRQHKEEPVDCWYNMSIYNHGYIPDIKKLLKQTPCIIRKLELIAPMGTIKTEDSSPGIELFFFHPFFINHTNPNHWGPKEYVEFDTRSIRRYALNIRYLKGITSEYNKQTRSNHADNLLDLLFGFTKANNI